MIFNDITCMCSLVKHPAFLMNPDVLTNHLLPPQWTSQACVSSWRPDPHTQGESVWEHLRPRPQGDILRHILLNTCYEPYETNNREYNHTHTQRAFDQRASLWFTKHCSLMDGPTIHDTRRVTSGWKPHLWHSRRGSSQSGNLGKPLGVYRTLCW
jgi:hypothetical protein